jgi:hypothetical protein
MVGTLLVHLLKLTVTRHGFSCLLGIDIARLCLSFPARNVKTQP